MRTNNFFNLTSMLKLYRQLHNKPETPFSTVGEVIKWRDALVCAEDEQKEAFVIRQSFRLAHIERLEQSDQETAHMALIGARRAFEEAKGWFYCESGKRMADIRAIATFLHRCGLEV